MVIKKRSISKPIKYKWTQVAYKFCFSQIISRKDSSCLQISAEKWLVNCLTSNQIVHVKISHLCADKSWKLKGYTSQFVRQTRKCLSKNIKWYNHKQHKGLVLVLLQFVGPAASLDNGQISHELRWLKRELGADWAFIVIGSTPTVTRETRQHSPGSQRAQDLFVRVITTALYLISQKKYQIFDHDYYCALL